MPTPTTHKLAYMSTCLHLSYTLSANQRPEIRHVHLSAQHMRELGEFKGNVIAEHDSFQVGMWRNLRGKELNEDVCRGDSD